MIRELYSMISGKQFGNLPFPQTAVASKEAALGGMVLLKNDGTLPLKTKSIALFGTGAKDTVFCGTGSGYAFSPYRISVYEGLKKAGFTITSEAWLARYEEAKKHPPKGKKLNFIESHWGGMTLVPEEPAIQREDISGQVDTAIYVISRQAGEMKDRRAVPGDYYLSAREEQNLRVLADAFRHTIVVLNTCVMDASVLESIPGISAILLMGLAGMEAGSALAEILSGIVSPSGRLTDTWAKRYEDYPASATFSANDGNVLQEDYTEDIFVGYRWFDSFGLDVQYPFGYGLSYTSFEYSNIKVEADWETVRISVDVENTGRVPGREVVQVYSSSPEGELIKPWQDLRGYAKTGLLRPGDKESVAICFPTEYLASYHEQKAAFVMEEGDYAVRIGSNSRCTRIEAWLRLDQTVIVRQVRSQLAPDHPLEIRKPAQPRPAGHSEAPVILLSAAECRTIHGVLPAETFDFSHPNHKAAFPDVIAGKARLEDFVASLDTKTLLTIVTGDSCERKHAVPSRLGKRKYRAEYSKAASGKTTAQFMSSLGIPAAALADGPAGLHLMGTSSATYPSGMVLAQNWDQAMSSRIGDCFGLEMERAKVSVLLGPGMNIHRDPLCGRNFEYYSEDPLLSGVTAAGFTRGLQENHPGCGVSIKHFAANSQEEDRYRENATISERALREIYLRGFELCVREACPMTVMTSYNKLNGSYTSSRKDLLTGILREEWGFRGLVMSDWDTLSEKAADLMAGNDLIMSGYPAEALEAEVLGKEPAFEPDGAVHTSEISMYYGMFHKSFEIWGRFRPMKDGEDTVTARLSKGKKLSKRAQSYVEQGIADVRTAEDGVTEIVYHGTDQGKCLPVEDVRRSALRVLKLLMQNAYLSETRIKQKRQDTGK